ncbi:MAG: DUF167 domain-containing protein [Bacteroidota bacterium]
MSFCAVVEFSSLFLMQIHCIVKTNSKIDSIIVNPDGSLRVKIKAIPVDGKANEYLVKYLSEVFELPKNYIQIISGFTSSHKRVNIVTEEQKIQSVLETLKSKI